tara:strand:- start:187 stop:429 length:243 start_codon:yes stop_codon:yes gene_type:complete
MYIFSIFDKNLKYIMEGTVKWFNEKKGYGFISSNEDGSDYFAHYKEIQAENFRTLKEGQAVTFEVGESDKGKMATNITVI